MGRSSAKSLVVRWNIVGHEVTDISAGHAVDRLCAHQGCYEVTRHTAKHPRTDRTLLSDHVHTIKYNGYQTHCHQSFNCNLQRRFSVIDAAGITVGCPSVRLAVASIDSSSGGRRVCCWAPCGYDISTDSCGRRAAGAGAQQKMPLASCWESTKEVVLNI